MKLFIYDIEKEETDQIEDFASLLEKAICNKKTGKDRLLMLNEAESDDADLICTHSYRNGTLCCSFIRLILGKESIVRVEELEKENVDIESVVKKAKEENAGSIKDVYYFAIRNSTLILNKNSAKALASYIGWILEESDIHIRFKFNHRISKRTDFRLEDVKAVKLEENYVNTRFSTEQKKMFYSLKKEIANMLLQDLPEKEKDYGKLISAQLLLKFKKKVLQSEDALKYALRSTDEEELTIETRNGQKFKGAEIKDQREVSPEKTSEGAVSWVSICKIMKDILMEYNVS